MANQPKKYKKFVATAATATLVASAIVPVASAAPSDIDNSQFKNEILEAIELGLFQDNASFNPTGTLKRGHVVLILGRYLEQAGYEAAEGYAENPAFSDLSVNADDEYLKTASIVKEAGVFTGYTDGTINWNGNITRENIAVVLDRLAKEVTDISLVDVAAEIEDENVADLNTANSSYRAAIQALRDLGISTADNFNPKGELKRGQFAKFIVNTLAVIDELVEVDPEPELTVEEAAKALLDAVTALPQEVNSTNVDAAKEAVAAANAALAALEAVAGENPSDEIKAGIEAAKTAIAATQAAIDALTEVTEAYSIKVTPAATTVSADGADNTVIKFELLDESGKVDTNADNMVLEISTTFGNLATNRVTVQDGVGQVVLSSEFSTKEIEAKVSAQVIEASNDYKDLIGKLAGEATVKFVPASVTTDPNAVTFQDAESNQADRVVLYFDKPVSSTTFVKVDKDGNFVTTADKKEQILKDEVTIKVAQGGSDKKVVGIVPVPGNSKAVEVLLDKSTTLTDNAKVELDVKIGTTRNQRDFTLTDARKPEFTGVAATNLRTLELKFSEAVLEGNFSIDGRWTAGKEFDVVLGDFDAVKGIDKRDTAEVKLKNLGGTTGQLYFAAGNHSITVTQLKDFAAATDTANVSTTQTLNFNVAEDLTAPTAEVTVESPEQFRVKFNKDVEEIANLDALFNNALKVYDEESKQWVALSSHSKAAFKTADILVAEQVSDNEIVVELKEDWTNILSVATDAYYNYEFKFEFDKDVFTSSTNGIKNVKFDLNLSATGSALTKADNVSPVIEDITQQVDPSEYVVTMNEPVKLPGKDTKPGNTQGKNQENLPAVYAEFQGKDKDGKAVVIPATVVDYTDKNKADKQFKIKTTDAQALQTLVDEKGYSENWTVVVRSISDDIGNTAATLTKDFTVKTTTTAKGFLIQSHENDLTNAVFAYDATKVGGKDRLEVTFTKGVNVSGPDNLISVYNWTLNGTQLSNLSNIESITVENVYGTEKDGFEKVVITFADDRAFGPKSNVVSVTKGIKSLDGTVLTGEYEVVAATIDVDGGTTTPVDPEPTPEPTPEEAALKALTDKVTEAEAVATEGKTAGSVKALEEAIAAAKEVAAKADATVEELEAAKKAIEDAVAGLVDETPGEVTEVTLKGLNYTTTANGITLKTSILLKADELPAELAGKTLSIEIDGQEVTFEPNPIDNNVLRVVIDTAKYNAAEFDAKVVTAK